MTRAKTKNDLAWEELFCEYKIIERVAKYGYFEITSSQINKVREARLMTKFDHKSNLPHLFYINNLCILPITRGKYVISSFNAYHKFEETSQDVIRVTPPLNLKSIDFENINSEAMAINVAYLSGILQHFVNDSSIVPTVNGRMSSDCFKFKIYNDFKMSLQEVCVENSQLEIDGGFEGEGFLALLEAKNSLSEDFLVRQLYYPFRKWSKKIDKPVKNIFMTYSNGIFSLYEYVFSEPNDYNSIELVHQKNYTFDGEEIVLDDIMDVLTDTVIINEEPYNIPFPQANDFNRVVNICELIHENGHLSKEYITSNYDFNVRQTSYYIDACRYLGLVEKKRVYGMELLYYLTDKGKSLFALNQRNRNLAFARYILEKKVFNLTFLDYLGKLEMPSKSMIVETMTSLKLRKMNINTKNRRASTIIGWLNWIIDLTR